MAGTNRPPTRRIGRADAVLREDSGRSRRTTEPLARPRAWRQATLTSVAKTRHHAQQPPPLCCYIDERDYTSVRDAHTGRGAGRTHAPLDAVAEPSARCPPARASFDAASQGQARRHRRNDLEPRWRTSDVG